MQILSWQPKECGDLLESGGTWRCDEQLAEWRDMEEFVRAYDWIASEMTKRIGPAPASIRWPVWGWARYDFVDISDGGRPSDDSMIDPHVDADYVRVLFDVPMDKVLLSDEDAWGSILMGYAVPPTRWCLCEWEDGAEPEFEKLLDMRRNEDGSPTADIIATWDRIFDVRKLVGPSDWNGRNVQSSTWEIRPEWVVRIERFHNFPHKSEFDYDFEEEVSDD